MLNVLPLSSGLLNFVLTENKDCIEIEISLEEFAYD